MPDLHVVFGTGPLGRAVVNRRYHDLSGWVG